MNATAITYAPPLFSVHESRDVLQSRQRNAYGLGKDAWRNGRINGQALQLYEELVRRVGANQYCWIGEETLAWELSRSISTIKRWMRQLVAAQLIRRDRQFGHTTHTYITSYDQVDINNPTNNQGHEGLSEESGERQKGTNEGCRQRAQPAIEGEALSDGNGKELPDEVRTGPSIGSDLVSDSFNDQHLKPGGGGQPTTNTEFIENVTTSKLQAEGVYDPRVLQELRDRTVSQVEAVIDYVAGCRSQADLRRPGLIVHLLRGGSGSETLLTRRSRTGNDDTSRQHCRVRAKAGSLPPGVEIEDKPVTDPVLMTTWQSVLECLSQEVPKETFEIWLRPTVLLDIFDGKLAVVGAPNVFVRDELEKHREIMAAALSRNLGSAVTVELAIGTGVVR